MNAKSGSERVSLDPYTASSLLQKAIRRGDQDEAIFALRNLYLHRKRGLWPRLVSIAFEDVGLGDLSLLSNVVATASARLSLAEETNEISALSDVVRRLSQTVKCRSSDHLCCAAEALTKRGADAGISDNLSTPKLVEAVANPGEPLVRRASILIGLSTPDKRSQRRIYRHRIAAIADFLPAAAQEIVGTALTAYRITKQPFVLLMPLMAAARDEDGCTDLTVDCDLAEAEKIGGVPAYTFDKHTWIGKRALGIFADRNGEVRNVLSEFTNPKDAAAITAMAAFHLDAALVDRKLVWSRSDGLERAGIIADMKKVGCPDVGIEPILNAVAENLEELNAIRREIKERRS